MPTPSQISIHFSACICGDPNCEIPYGYCHCGCGELAPIAKRTTNPYSNKGKPVRFIPGHVNRNRKVPIVLDVCPFEYEGDLCRRIPLTQGQVAIVWESDYEWLNQWNWFAYWNPKTKGFYAARGFKGEDGKWHQHQMHRQILNVPFGDPREVDHKNPSGTLDNRRTNLRIADNSQQTCNQRLRSDNKTGYKGVQYLPKLGKYAARINHKHLGLRDTAKAAYEELYVPAAIRLHGEFARLA